MLTHSKEFQGSSNNSNRFQKLSIKLYYDVPRIHSLETTFELIKETIESSYTVGTSHVQNPDSDRGIENLLAGDIEEQISHKDQLLDRSTIHRVSLLFKR